MPGMNLLTAVMALSTVVLVQAVALFFSFERVMESKTRRLDTAMHYNLRIANHEEWHEVKDVLERLPWQLNCGATE